MADAMEMMILSILAPQLHCEWRLPSWQVALLTSVGSPASSPLRHQFWSPEGVFCRMPPSSSCCCQGFSRQELSPEWNHQDLSIPSPFSISCILACLQPTLTPLGGSNHLGAPDILLNYGELGTHLIRSRKPYKPHSSKRRQFLPHEGDLRVGNSIVPVQ